MLEPGFKYANGGKPTMYWISTLVQIPHWCLSKKDKEKSSEREANRASHISG